MSNDMQLRMIGHLERPEELRSTTYRIMPSTQEDAIYITIADHEVEGKLRPFEMFLVTKEPTSFQWISALMRLLSSRLQEPGPFPSFLISELIDNHDTLGGYFTTEKFLRANNKPPRAHGIVSHVGLVFQHHCKGLGLLRTRRKS